MKITRIIKISIITVLSIVVLAGVGVAALVLFVNPNNYKPLIIKSVDATTGRKLSLEGNITWKIWPNLGLHIESVALSNPDGFKQANMVTLNSADVSVQLLPLLKNSIIVNTLAVDGLNLGLIKNGDTNNWTFNAESGPATPGEPSAPAPKMNIELSGLSLKNSSISYIDMKANSNTSIKDFDFSVKAGRGGTIAINQDQELATLKNVSFSFDDLIKGEIDLTVNNFSEPQYKGNIDISEFSIVKLSNKLNMPIKALAGKDLFNSFAIKTKLNGDKNKLTLDDTSFNFGKDIQGQVNLAVNNLSSDNPQYKGKLKLDEFSLNTVLDKLAVSKANRANNQMLNKFATSTNFAGDTKNIKLDNLIFNFADHLKGTLNVSVSNFANPSYSGGINLPAFSLNYVLDQADIAKADRVKNHLLDSVALQSQFSGNTDSVSLQQTSFNLSNLLKGTTSVKVQNFKQPSYLGNVNLATFSLNQVMEKSGMKPVDIPNKTLLDKVSYQSNFSGTASSINLTQLLATMANTTVAGGVNVQSFKPLKLTENVTVNQVELSDLADTYGYKLPLKGIKASGSYSRSGDDLATLNANQNISADNVTILGFSLDSLVTELDNAITNTGKVVTIDNLQQINNSIEVINGIKRMQAAVAKAQTKGAKDYNQKTNLGSVQTNVVITNGVANPATYKLSGPTIKSTGQGSINLARKNLNYTVTTQLITPQKNDILNHISFPYNVHGSLEKPEGSLDWGAIQKQVVEYLIANTTKQVKSIAKEQATKQINTVIDQQVPQGAEPLKQGAQKLINGIFGN